MRRVWVITLGTALVMAFVILGSLTLWGEPGSVSGAGENQMAADADADTPGVDSSSNKNLDEEFDVSVHITAAPTPYQGFDMYLEFDDSILAWVPVGPKRVVYPGLGGMILDATSPPTPPDRDSDGDPEVYGGSARDSGTTSATGEAVKVRFECIGVGSSSLHLLTAGEYPASPSKTYGAGGAPITTLLADASITCEPTPTPTVPPTPTPMPTPTPTPTPKPVVLSVDMDPAAGGVQALTTIDINVSTDFSLDIVVENILPPGLAGFSFDLVYDDSRLDATGISEGPFLSSAGASISCPTKDPAVQPGRARLTCSVDSGDYAQGSGIVGSIDFNVPTGSGDIIGEDPLAFGLEATSLTDPVLNPIVHTTQDGEGQIIGEIDLLFGEPGVPGTPEENRTDDPHGVFDTGTPSSIYFADTGNNLVRKITDGGTITVAGIHVGDVGGCPANPDISPYDGCPATDAVLSGPVDVFVDASGNLYIADTGHHRIRMVVPGADGVVDGDADEIISTVAGTGVGGLPTDGVPATSSQVNGPRGVAIDAFGNMLIADTENNRIRKVVPGADGVVNGGTDEIITTVVGAGSGCLANPTPPHDGCLATDAVLNRPHDVYPWWDWGDYIIADTDNHRIRWVQVSTGAINTLAGTGTGGFNGDDRRAIEAQLNAPEAIAAASDLYVYIADTQNHRIRRVDKDGVITTVAGDGTRGYGGDGGPSTDAHLDSPAGIAVGSPGTISDTNNEALRGIDPVTGEPGGSFGGTVSCVAGTIATADWLLVALTLGLILAWRRLRPAHLRRPSPSLQTGTKEDTRI